MEEASGKEKKDGVLLEEVVEGSRDRWDQSNLDSK